MNLKHPYGWIKEESRKRVFIVTFIFTILMMLIFQVIDASLQTDVAPMGIVSFELAGSMPAARGMIDSWGAEGELYAMFSLGFDYLFMLVYAVAIGLGCVLTAQNLPKEKKFMISAGVVLAWGLIAAALLDVIENWCLTVILLGATEGLWAEVAMVSASVKFIIIIAALLYLVAGGIMVLRGKQLNEKS